MGNCSSFCGRQGTAASTSSEQVPQGTAASTSSEQVPQGTAASTSSEQVREEVIAKLQAINDPSNVDELIQIIRKILQSQPSGKSTEDIAESSQSVASDLISSGTTFFKFVTDHVEKSSNKEDFLNSAPQIIGDVLNKVGNVHWLVAGLSVIGYVLQTADAMSQNYKRCLDLLEKLVDLLDHVKILDYRLRDQELKLKKATMVIVKGCILCHSQLSSHKLRRFFKASVNAQALSSFEEEIRDLRQDLTLTAVEQGAVLHPQLPPAYPVHSVGLAEGQQQVIKLLQTTSQDTQPMAVVIYGFGGIGKTTLAEAVVAAVDLKAYHYARVDFNIDSLKNDIKSLQEQILNGLFPNYTLQTKTELTNCSHGRAVLTKAFKNEGNKPIFLFIDNALRKQDLYELLPRDMKSLPKGSRILVTTRELNSTDTFIEDEAGLERKHYLVQPLSDQDAKIFLLKDIADRNPGNIKDEDLEKILNICKGVPLVLKIVRGHFRKQGYKADNCRQILRALETGEQVKEEELSNTLTDFVYDHLEDSSQQAFLDICCFFYDWNPFHVEYIVGAQELTSLEEAAFVQRSDDKKKLIVHDVIRERGRKKAESTRIMNVESLIDAADEQRLKDVRGVWLVNQPECVVEEQHLKAMTKLQILALGKSTRVSHPCEATFKKLRYLEVHGDIPCLPVNLDRLPELEFYVGPLFKEGFSMYKVSHLHCKYESYSPDNYKGLVGMWEKVLTIKLQK